MIIVAYFLFEEEYFVKHYIIIYHLNYLSSILSFSISLSICSIMMLMFYNLFLVIEGIENQIFKLMFYLIYYYYFNY